MADMNPQLPVPPKRYGLPPALHPAHDWIIDHVQKTYGKSIADVHVVAIPGFKGGGGGLYCKNKDTDEVFTELKGGAEKYGKNVPLSELAKGNFLLVRSDCNKPAALLAITFIMWHEFGHALADRGHGNNDGEKWSLEFEIATIAAAVTQGALPQGATKEGVRAFIEVRNRKNYRNRMYNLHASAVLNQLGQFPTAPTDEYLLVAAEVCVNNFGTFDSLDYGKVLKDHWRFDANQKRAIKSKISQVQINDL